MFSKITIQAISPDGWPVLFELEEGKKTTEATAYLEKYGFRPAPTTQEPPHAVEGQPVGGSAMTNSFAADTLTATVDDGKAYWKIRGGQFMKFGVAIYPEVLAAAGFDVDALNPLKPVDLVGWTAVYAVKENGKAQKVIRLAK